MGGCLRAAAEAGLLLLLGEGLGGLGLLLLQGRLLRGGRLPLGGGRVGGRLGPLGAGLRQRRLVHRELDGVGLWPGAEVVHAGLEALAPGVEVHRGELPRGGLGHVDVEGLGLADEGAAVGGHVEAHLLLDLPHGLVQVLHVLRDLPNLLHRPLVRDHLRAHLLGPEAAVDEVAEEVLVHHHELPAQSPAVVHVRGEGFDGLVVAQDLRRGRRGHGRHQQ
mmetsp:Transcript_39604/g.88624  ORF Transcript_39604/g.88624 Transcript_39604/m.88624 type:complete len:220 (+) Transcript_39604:262-921(+)